MKLYRSFFVALIISVFSMAGLTGITVASVFAEGEKPSSGEMTGGERLLCLLAYPADTKSPRSTLESFLFLTRSYFDFIKEDGYTAKNIEELKNIELQVAKLFDLREIPPSFRQDVSMEAAVYLREVLARVSLPDINKVPDENDVAEMIKQGIEPFYRIPGTVIEIERINDGPYNGHYQFTRDTLESAEMLYDQAEEYPLREKGMEGFYEAYFLTPGPAISLGLIRSLPKWMAHEYEEQTIWQWAFLCGSVLLLVICILFLCRITRRISRDMSPLHKSLVALIKPVLTILLTVALIRFLDEQVFLTGEVLRVVVFIAHLVILYCAVVITLVSSKIFSEKILLSTRFKEEQVNKHLIRIGIRLSGIVVAIVILLQGLHQLGFSLATLLAGASVTGLAVALAAQDTLKNIFGSIMLLMDKPFMVGQRINVKNHDGFVEGIGMRSTRMRTPTGHLISIPNEDMARADIKTIGQPGFIKRKFNITVTYDTSPDKIKLAVQLIKEILSVPGGDADKERAGGKTHPNAVINMENFPPRVFFNEFNSDSLNIVVYYWYYSTKYWEFLSHSEWVNMEIIRRFTAEGIDFAFPTQTLYLAGDKKRPLLNNNE